MAFNIIALGKSEFLLGFELAGIPSLEAKNPEQDFQAIFEKEEIGIVITDVDTMNALPEHFREDVEKRVKPVTVVVSSSTVAAQALRQKIKKSIGVDLWKD